MARSFAFLSDPTPTAHDTASLWHLHGARRQPAPRDLIHDRVASLCARYAGAHAQLHDQVISVRGSGPFGIDIAVCLIEDACTLWLGGWHDEMPDADLALRYVRVRSTDVCGSGCGAQVTVRARGSSSAGRTTALGSKKPSRVLRGSGRAARRR